MEIKNTNHIFTNDLKPSERFAIWITYRIGTIGFFLIIFLWTLLWLGWNMFVGQNLQAKRAEIRAENDYNVNIKAEKEVALLTKEVSELKKMMKKISAK